MRPEARYLEKSQESSLRVKKFNSENLPRPRLDPPSVKLLGYPTLDLEIGCGLGRHSVQYAKSNPGRFLIAIEHTHSRATIFKERAAALNLPNLFPVHANAISWVSHYLQPKSLNRIFILYPNPFPKQRQANQRWHRMPFMERLLECLKPGGEIHLSTNLRFYAEEAVSYFLGYWKLRGLKFESFQKSSNGDSFHPETHFEKKYYERGEQIYRMAFQKMPAHQDSNLGPSD